MDELAGPWQTQSAVSHVGRAGPAIDELPADLAALRRVSRELVAHYMGNSDGSTAPLTPDRLAEVDTRYADAMLARLLAHGPLTRSRAAAERTGGCCRDFSLLFVAMARHKGIPARLRVGYAGYFRPGWHLDHVIAEVWDRDGARWRLIEPEISDALAERAGIDPLDVAPDRFLIGARAWLEARAGAIDPERCVVAPDLQIPYTRGWLSLRHHVVQDLAALAKAEVLLWDQWGILEEGDPLARSALLDELAAAIADPGVPASEVARWSHVQGLAVEPLVSSYSPTGDDPLQVDVRRTLTGRL